MAQRVFIRTFHVRCKIAGEVSLWLMVRVDAISTFMTFCSASAAMKGFSRKPAKSTKDCGVGCPRSLRSLSLQRPGGGTPPARSAAGHDSHVRDLRSSISALSSELKRLLMDTVARDGHRPPLQGGPGSALEIGIAGEALAVEVEDFAAFLGRDAAVGDGLFGEVAEFRHQFLRVVFDIGEHVGHGVALDLMSVHRLALVEVDADDIGIT